MFARPRYSSNKHVGVSGGAQDLDHTFTNIVKPLFSRSAEDVNKAVEKAMEKKNMSSKSESKITRNGDSLSYHINSHDNSFIDRRSARRGYRVLSYKEDAHGRKVVFDLLQGTVYNCGKSSSRITQNVIIFVSKDSAIAEKFPTSQVSVDFLFAQWYLTRFSILLNFLVS